MKTAEQWVKEQRCPEEWASVKEVQAIQQDAVKELKEFIRNCRDNWDCDKDAHRYQTQCRRCEAKKLLKGVK